MRVCVKQFRVGRVSRDHYSEVYKLEQAYEAKRHKERVSAHSSQQRKNLEQEDNSNDLKLLLESKMLEILKLRDIIDISKLGKESFEHEFRIIEKKYRESEDEKRSLINLVDLSNNLILNYENLIVNYRTNLESSKEESKKLKAENELLKKLSKEGERREKSRLRELKELKIKLNNESIEKQCIEQSVEEMMSIIEQYQDHIGVLENHMVDLVIENQNDKMFKILPIKKRWLRRTLDFQKKIPQPLEC